MKLTSAEEHSRARTGAVRADEAEAFDDVRDGRAARWRRGRAAAPSS